VYGIFGILKCTFKRLPRTFILSYIKFILKNKISTQFVTYYILFYNNYLELKLLIKSGLLIFKWNEIVVGGLIMYIFILGNVSVLANKIQSKNLKLRIKI